MEGSKYKIFFYKDGRGIKPAKEYLLSISKKVRAKVFYIIEKLEKLGPDLKRPHADYLRNGIYELRIEFQKNQYRILYFFMIERKIYLSHGFLKKDWKVPNNEIEKAIKHKKIIEGREKK